ncbi:quinone oxidoreductase-like protein 1 [Amycolatopsis sp. NPDC059021]|uniref:quinone oxidoreductase-like protein 1 n=1 Tax=Amycolatopsis sp. NPDC059021 TaxID=3346704 RepID=UPI00366D105D
MTRKGPPAFQLVTDRPGQWSAIRYRGLPRRPPAEGEVEIAVDAAGLNYYDVIKALDLTPSHSGNPALFGGECAGTITSAGPGVTTFAPGDAVIACAFGAAASHVVARADHVQRIPDGWTTAEAAGLVLAAATAWHGLVQLGRLTAGETVLIHSAAGGVGLAAIQVARLVGARVVATAGTERKRAALRGLGITHVFDSRSGQWSEQVRSATRERGVDVVLNSLTGRAGEHNLDALGEDGRYIELSRFSINQGGTLALGPFAKRLTFSAVDLSGFMRTRPDRFAALLAQVGQLAAAGSLAPLPVARWPFAGAVAALREFAKGRHIGKFVLVRPETVRNVLPDPCPMSEPMVRSRA